MTDEPMNEPQPAALLDAEGYFVRMEVPDEMTERHLPQITECDLPPNAYKWNGQTFIHAPKVANEFSITTSTELAIVKGFEAVQAAGIALPKETEKYLAEFRKTIDYVTPQETE